jgi:hypothetical protein
VFLPCKVLCFEHTLSKPPVVTRSFCWLCGIFNERDLVAKVERVTVLPSLTKLTKASMNSPFAAVKLFGIDAG